MENSILNDFEWLNKPKNFVVASNSLIIETEPGTDFWQRTYYGFRNNNAPAFLTKIHNDFTFKVKTEFEETSFMYDQCGVFLYVDSENWIKISVEYENEKFSRLGSVVTNLGYSDWATTDISAGISEMWYRVSRRGHDFFIENSLDGKQYKQMRMLHLHSNFEKIGVGVYACSPLKSNFNAVFSEFKIGVCEWPLYQNHE